MGEQDSKAKRYDRQIRIWGAEGQARLESSRIVLLNCGPTGSETLKNLVLGGIASFTIVDGKKVEPRDLGNNFLVEPGSLGEPRAKVVTELLKEMNETVMGSYVEEDPEELIRSNPGFFKDFDLVVATQLGEPIVLALDQLCREQGVSLIIVRSYGLLGYLRLSLAEHCVVESKPETQVDDLRVTCPWPELQECAASIDLGSVDDATHRHVPYVILLLHALQQWRATHDGQLPSSSKDRAQFKEQLRGMKRVSPEGVPLDQDNFDEALKAAFHAWTPPSIPPEVSRLLADAAVTNLGPSSSDFWVLVAALKAFVEEEGGGLLPMEGSIPDMAATTNLYLQLQRLYRARANKDAAAVEAHANRILGELAARGPGERSISADAVRNFCRNARSLRCIRFRPLADEVSGAGGRGAALAAAMAEEGMAANAGMYVLLRAADQFHTTHGRYPGVFAGDLDDDVPLLKAAAQQLLSKVGATGATVQDDYASEMCRWGAAELHVVASVMGGVAAQEAIKLITAQFVPFTGTFIYNAMASTTSVLDL